MSSPPELRVAVFTKHFLEPTHYAIAATLSALPECRFGVWAKRLSPGLAPPVNVEEYAVCPPGSFPRLSRDRYDLVHAIFDGDLAQSAAAAARRADLPLVLSFHGGFDVHVKIFRPESVERVREIAREAAAVTVVCAADRRRLRLLSVRRPIEVIPVPIDPALVPRRGRVEPGHLIVIARLVEKKGVDTAIETLRHLPDGFRLTVVGDGPLEPDLRRQVEVARLEKRVDFAGRLPLAEALRRAAGAELLLHPGRVAPDGNAEGTPQAILWAQALGLPVLACDSGSLGEIVAHRRTGMLVAPDQPTLLARAVLELRSQPQLCRRIVTAARRQVLRRHALPRVTGRILGLYRQHAGIRPCTARAT